MSLHMQCFEIRGCKRHEFTSPQKIENKLGLTGICKKMQKRGKRKIQEHGKGEKISKLV